MPEAREVPQAPVISEARAASLAAAAGLLLRGDRRRALRRCRRRPRARSLLPRYDPVAAAPAAKPLPIEKATPASVRHRTEDETPLVLSLKPSAQRTSFPGRRKWRPRLRRWRRLKPEQPANEISTPTEAARIELAKEEPTAVEPVAAQGAVRQPEAIAPKPEPLTFAAAAEPVETRGRARGRIELPPGSRQRIRPGPPRGRVAAGWRPHGGWASHDDDDDNGAPFASLVDSLEVSDDALQAPSEPLATAAASLPGPPALTAMAPSK